jgi:hypothetical protein
MSNAVLCQLLPLVVDHSLEDQARLFQHPHRADILGLDEADGPVQAETPWNPWVTQAREASLANPWPQ